MTATPDVPTVTRADWQQAYQDALRIAKQRDQATTDAELLNDPFLRSLNTACDRVLNPGHSVRVA